MLVVFDQPNITQKEAGDAQRIDRTTIGQITDALTSKGFLERHPYPKDRRAYQLRLTPKGEETLIQLRTETIRCENECLSCLDSREKEQYLHILKTILKENEHE